MTPVDWAVALGVIWAIGFVWSILDPDAVKVEYRNPWRALVTIASFVALVGLVATACALSTLAVVVIVLAVLFLSALHALADR